MHHASRKTLRRTPLAPLASRHTSRRALPTVQPNPISESAPIVVRMAKRRTALRSFTASSAMLVDRHTLRCRIYRNDVSVRIASFLFRPKFAP
jgi:hypothetical protein